MITREQFIEATGYAPEQDDLERVNCPNAGEIGHMMCGWDYRHNKPVFEGRLLMEDKVSDPNDLRAAGQDQAMVDALKRQRIVTENREDALKDALDELVAARQQVVELRTKIARMRFLMVPTLLEEAAMFLEKLLTIVDANQVEDLPKLDDAVEKLTQRLRTGAALQRKEL